MLLFQQMVVLFIYMMIGYVSCKKGKLDEAFGKKISWLVLNVANPMMILTSATNGSGSIKGNELVLTAVIAFSTFLFMIVLAIFVPKIFKLEHDEESYFKLMTVFNNIGFMGFPVISAIYGNEALLYGAIFLLPYNMFFYTYGVNLVSKEKHKFKLKSVINVGIIASVLAVILYLTQTPVPQFAKSIVQGLGNLPAPLSMMVIGISMAQLDIKEAFFDVKMLLFAMTKLILIPICGMLIIKQFVTTVELQAVCLVMLATPAGSMTAMLAQQHGGNYKRVAQGVSLTTLLSVVTIPLVMMLML